MRWKPEQAKLTLVSATEDELRKADTAASLFGGAHPQSLPLANEIRAGLQRKALSRKTVEQFSKWLDTGGSYDAAQTVAHDLSVALFGVKIDRMLDQSNARTITAGIAWYKLRGKG